MPHYKDGKKAQLFDRVKFRSGTSYPAAGEDGKRLEPEPIFADGLVVGIQEGGGCCELVIAAGPLNCLGMQNGVQFAGDAIPPRNAVLLQGWWTQMTAKDCELIPRVDAPL